MTKAIALPFVLLFGWTALGVECLDFNGGTCRAAQGGGFELSMPQGVLKINPTWVTPGWGFNCIFARELGTIQVDVGKRLERET